MPKRPASHGQSRRKRGRRRYGVPAVPPATARPSPDAPKVVPFPAASRSSSEARPASKWITSREQRLVNRELIRIGIIAVGILILLAILTFVL